MADFIIRRSHLSDLDALLGLGHLLNSMNLPDEPSAIQKLLQLSHDSFSGRIKEPFMRHFLFVMIESKSQRIVGSCQVIAQHGTREAPHIFFEVFSEEHYSSTLDKLIEHQVLRLGFNYDGPTEIGGLIVDPAFRSHPQKLGRQLSLMRFLFIAANRACFKNQVLAEMMPPLLPSGQSALWEAFGRRFTDLDYHEADFLSRTNKEFVKSLLPDIPIYTRIFDPAVQKIIGTVGPETQAAVHILEAQGFRYYNRVDPFDGGPHLQAATDDIMLLKNARSLRVSKTPLDPLLPHEPTLLLSCRDIFSDKADVRCIFVPCVIDDDTIALSADDQLLLGVQAGDTVLASP